jgi:hypothetical protein
MSQLPVGTVLHYPIDENQIKSVGNSEVQWIKQYSVLYMGYT